MGLFSNNDIWESLRGHTKRLDDLNKDLLGLKEEIESLKDKDTQILTKLTNKIDNIKIPNVQPIINSLKEKFNKRCSEIENTLLLVNSQILELNERKPVDVKALVKPMIQEINDKIEILSNRINALNDDRLKLIEELKPKEAELPKLTDKQQKVLNLMKEGKTIKEIAEASKVSFQSIYQTIRAIKSKGYDV